MNIIHVRKYHGVDACKLSLLIMPFIIHTLVRVTDTSQHHSCVSVWSLGRNETSFFIWKFSLHSNGYLACPPYLCSPFLTSMEKRIIPFALWKMLIHMHRVQTISMVWHYDRWRDKNIKNSMNFSSNVSFPLCFTQQKLSLKMQRFMGFRDKIIPLD